MNDHLYSFLLFFLICLPLLIKSYSHFLLYRSHMFHQFHIIRQDQAKDVFKEVLIFVFLYQLFIF